MLTVMGDHEKFVSELIFPIALVAPTVIGEPGIPIRFRWRGAEYEIARVVEKWKQQKKRWWLATTVSTSDVKTEG
jgi:hypothetical protein